MKPDLNPPAAVPETRNSKLETRNFACPYCGPDDNGAEVHALTHHTSPALTEAQALAQVDSAIRTPHSAL